MQTYADAAAFLERAQPFLVREEAMHGLLLGVTIRMRDGHGIAQSRPYLAIVDAKPGQLALAAAMTTQHDDLLLAAVLDVQQSVLDQLAENLRSNGCMVTGVSAESRLALRFAETWSRQTGQAHFTKMRMRAYELRQVIPPNSPPSGRMRTAEPADLETITRWRAAFTRESLHEEPEPDIAEEVAHRIQVSSIYVWDDQRLASMAVSTRPTPSGIWIGGVYTPPEYRGHGYASACVAAVSQRLLDSGKSFVALFTDLDYPTSNSIYPKIGYRPIGDFLVIRFH